MIFSFSIIRSVNISAFYVCARYKVALCKQACRYDYCLNGHGICIIFYSTLCSYVYTLSSNESHSILSFK